MQLDPMVHDQFVQDFGINMLNTLTLRENRVVAHRRRIFVFDERGGMFGGEGSRLSEYQNLTTGVFHSRQRQIVGVRYRCRPNTLESAEVGAFHTHPVAFSKSLKQIRTRIERLLWMSDMDRKAFLKQYELYGYEWHFIGAMDIGCFHIDDVRRDIREPRLVLRYDRLEEAVAHLAPQIRFYDEILKRHAIHTHNPNRELLEHIVRDVTTQKDDLLTILHNHDMEELQTLAGKVAQRFQLLGYTSRQVSQLVKRTVHKFDVTTPPAQFHDHLRNAYDRLSFLTS